MSLCSCLGYWLCFRWIWTRCECRGRGLEWEQLWHRAGKLWHRAILAGLSSWQRANNIIHCSQGLYWAILRFLWKPVSACNWCKCFFSQFGLFLQLQVCISKMLNFLLRIVNLYLANFSVLEKFWMVRYKLRIQTFFLQFWVNILQFWHLFPQYFSLFSLNYGFISCISIFLLLTKTKKQLSLFLVRITSSLSLFHSYWKTLLHKHAV